MWHFDVPFQKNKDPGSESGYDCCFHINPRIIWLHFWQAWYLTVHSVYCNFSLYCHFILHPNLPSKSDLCMETCFWTQIALLDVVHLHKRMLCTSQGLSPAPGTADNIVPLAIINQDRTCIHKSQWPSLFVQRAWRTHFPRSTSERLGIANCQKIANKNKNQKLACSWAFNSSPVGWNQQMKLFTAWVFSAVYICTLYCC